MMTLHRALKATARGLSSVALIGCALSLCVHLVSLAGVYTPLLFKVQVCLFFAVFPIGVTAILAQEWLLSKFSVDRLSPRMVRAVLFARTPLWLRNGSDALGAYAVAVFIAFAIRTFPGKGSKLDELRLFSAYPPAFYAGFAAILTTYASTERPLPPDEIEV